MTNYILGGSRIYRDTLVAHVRPAASIEEGVPEALADGKAADSATIPGDSYMTALLKLVPTEVIGIYMAIRDNASQHDFVTGWCMMCLVTCIVLRSYSSMTPGVPPSIRSVQWVSVMVSAIAFVLWASSIEPQQPIPFLHLQQWLASALAPLFGLLAPLIVPAAARQTTKT